ncbi:MAG: SpoVR family protein [Firmicutes bacterium]|nr:SpoVR family protein [Alicyclobacillaceae bacterium]MCL6496458.1 SpoVR family protein [Bacillota bacterium]
MDPDGLRDVVEQVGEVAERLGLPLWPVHFELVPSTDLPRLAAYGGLPVRYAHWSFGKQWGRLKTAYDYRQSQIYEMVINHHPAYAYLDASLSRARTLVVVAHVLAHVHVFRQHRLFRDVPKDAVAIMARHRRQFEAWRRTYGLGAVESLIDAAHPWMEFVGRPGTSCGEDPQDVLGFVVRYGSCLADWERELLAALWREGRYFWPQVLTKVVNEGYATFWHRRIVREVALKGPEAWEVAKMQSELLAVHPPELNPYRLGVYLLDEAWASSGAAAVEDAATFLDDCGLVRTWLTPRTAARIGLGVVSLRDGAPAAPTLPFEDLKARLVRDLDHGGIPRLEVDREATRPGGTLVLRHCHDGRDLDFEPLPRVLEGMARHLWRGPVVLHTRRHDTPHRLTCEGGRCLDFAGES